VSELISDNLDKVSEYKDKKIIEYSCGCVYSFNHYTRLERVCPDHENELIAQCWNCGEKSSNWFPRASHNWETILSNL